jgi:ferredoxin--NADP+ reductase
VVERAYSIASSPDEPELEFFLELVAGGRLTPQLFGLRPGSVVYLRPSAKGRFVLDTGSGNQNHLMVASVTGIAPFVSMLRSLTGQSRETQFAGSVLVIHSASLPVQFGYREELARMACEHAWLNYVTTVSRIWLDGTWTGERGRAEDIVRKYADAAGYSPEATSVYVCGNPQMVRNIQGVMQRAGWPPQAVREELYWKPLTSS